MTETKDKTDKKGLTEATVNPKTVATETTTMATTMATTTANLVEAKVTTVATSKGMVVTRGITTEAREETSKKNLRSLSTKEATMTGEVTTEETREGTREEAPSNFHRNRDLAISLIRKSTSSNSSL